MRLINEQPMDTLPETGSVWVEYFNNNRVFAKPQKDTTEMRVDVVRARMNMDGEYTFVAWSYDATTKPKEQQ